jgi:putative proteasome-type protease
MLDKGMIFASDSRTNAGVDNFAKFCKMTVFERRGDRVVVLLSSGNLAGTQAVISVLTQRCADGDAATNLWGARTMFDVVRLVSDAMRDIENRDAGYLEENNIRFNASFIVGGQIGGEPIRLFRIYAEGNFIEAGILPGVCASRSRSLWNLGRAHPRERARLLSLDIQKPVLHTQ